ncbi:MAG TPA: DNA-formamidopyrimidine glycosylase family protein [Candidatus Limnocylindrales bacterium]|nr:DNA-formamidopyrimidine glycosylase family protein [Candidatus Limnocylindrales bacterium]
MPEGDTIWRTAAALRARIAGKPVQSVWPPRLARLRGRQVIAVEAKGKHLFIRFEGDLSLHSHMRMTGSWHVYQPGARWHQPRPLAKAVLTFPEVVAVCFLAPVVELVRDGADPAAHLGPDILAPTFDLARVIERARGAGSATIGELLLDQRVCAGIGNLYKCEALWMRRVDPWTHPQALDERALSGLYREARDLMRRSVAGAGFRRRNAVHARGGRPCPRCGTSVQVRPQGIPQRLTYWCPRCQPGPGSTDGDAV